MKITTAFVSIVFVSYLYLSVVGHRCALESGRMVGKALGRRIAESPTFSQLFVLWVSGLTALLEGEEEHIAKCAELYLDAPGLTSADKKKIREVVREHRKKFGLS